MGLVLLLALGLAIVWISAVGNVAWMLTHPPRRTYASAVARGRPGEPSELPGPSRRFEEWEFESRGLAVPVWEIAGDRPEGPTIVLSHGWADSRIGGLMRVAALAPLASRLVLWDLPGHGEAPGASRLGTAEVQDLAALLERLGGGQVVLYGWSLGAGVAIAAAHGRSNVTAVIAESPYRLAATPARNVLRARGLPHGLILGPALRALGLTFPGLGDRAFDRSALAAELPCPLLVLHGDTDVVCPAEDGRAIAAAAPRGELAVIEGGGHNDLWTNQALAERCTAAIAGFLGRIIETAQGRT